MSDEAATNEARERVWSSVTDLTFSRYRSR